MPREAPKPPKSMPPGKDPDSTIPTRIRQLRKGLGMTAGELDECAGLGVGTVGRLERGDQRVYANHLFRIASALGVDIGWFFDHSGPDDDAKSVEGHQNAQARRLLDAYLSIEDPALKRDVFDLVQSLADGPMPTPTKPGTTRR